MLRPQIRRDANSRRQIKNSEIFHYKGKRLLVRWEVLFSKLLSDEELKKEDVQLLIKAGNKYFRSEPNMLYLHDPVTIVGDIHGQFYDLKEIFRLGENPGTMTKYLFLGDYVDRGNYSLEVILVLYALKISFPNEVFLLRGNHECKLMTVTHNFRTDCLDRYDQEVYAMFIDSFNNLPISCIINGKYLAVHGGLSPQVESILEINEVNRFMEPPQEGVLCDLLWADPTFEDGGLMKDKYASNDSRGCSFYFGYEATINFLRRNELLTIIRAHEVQYEGYRAYHWGNSVFPVLMTVFSAPNYCGHHQNKGAILKVNQNEIQIMQYCFTEKQELQMDFPDVFQATWGVLKDGINEISNNLQRNILQNGYQDDIPDPILDREFDVLFPKIKHLVKFKINEDDSSEGVLRPIKVGIRKSKAREEKGRPRSHAPSTHNSNGRRTMLNSQHSYSMTNLRKTMNLAKPTGPNESFGGQVTRTPQMISNNSGLINSSLQGKFSGNRPTQYGQMSNSSNSFSKYKSTVYNSMQPNKPGYMSYSSVQQPIKNNINTSNINNNSQYMTNGNAHNSNNPRMKVVSTVGALKHSGVIFRGKFEEARAQTYLSEKRP